MKVLGRNCSGIRPRFLSIYAVEDGFVTAGVDREYGRKLGDPKDLVDVVIQVRWGNLQQIKGPAIIFNLDDQLSISQVSAHDDLGHMLSHLDLRPIPSVY